MKKKYLYIGLIAFSFFAGIFSKNSLKKIYFENFYSLRNNFLLSKNNFNPICIPKKINKIPKNSTLVIGHAYGNQYKRRSNISPNFENFYNQNKENIKIVIFSGDILFEPSLKKWNSLYSKFEKNLNIYIAPGNHDVGSSDNSKRDIFNIVKHRNQEGYKFPFYFRYENVFYIIDDSNHEKDPIQRLVPIIKKAKLNERIIIIRHHVLEKSLIKFSNDKKKYKINNQEIYFKKINDYKSFKNITFIYGDGGATKYQPRIACIKSGENTHILNGIGDIKGDTILLIKDQKIYRVEIL